MARLVTAGALALAAAFVPASAIAAPSFLPAIQRTLTATNHRCASTSYRAPMAGFLTVRDDGTTRGDWDLSVVDRRARRALATSDAFGSHEVAQTFVVAGQRLAIKGCRVSGPDSTFPVDIAFSDAKPPKLTRQSLVRVQTADPGILRRLDSLGFDVTENVQKGHADVVVPSPAKLDLLRKLGVAFKVRTLDLAKYDLKTQRADAAYAARVGAAGSPLPSGRTGYRTLADYQSELKALVKDHPGLVRPVTLGQTFQGRQIQGIELSENVDAPNDGRPTFLLVGEHHAREWPSAEIAMEFAHYLVDGYGSDDQVTSLVKRERIVIVPIVNVDGFNASRGTAEDGYVPDPYDSTGVPEGDTAEGVALPFGGNLAYRRKNCDGVIPNGPNHEEQNLPCYYQIGVDPNRNYGQNWGGVGASSDPNTQSYRGAGQWSEPETQAVWHWSQVHNVTFMMTLHNVAALVLRPPGVHTDGLAPDEQRMKELGDAMAADTGYTSQYGWQLYDTSGTTEDWQYGGQGAFGYTIEIGPEGGQFHMPYDVGVVQQWTGDKDHQGRGLRAALLKAAESAGNPGDHSVIEGAAPAGALLHLHKQFKTESSPICTYAQGLLVAGGPLSPLDCVAPSGTTSADDHLDYTMVVPSTGHYEWHVTPSTRPFVFQKTTPGGFDATAYKTDTYDAATGDVPADDRFLDDNAGTDAGEAHYSATRRFTVAPDEVGNHLVVDLNWDVPAQDYDLSLYHVKADGSLEGAGSSGNPNGVPEEITVDHAQPGDYLAHIVYYLTGAPQTGQGNDWHLTVSRFKAQPDKVETGREEWTMSCDTSDGKALESKQVYVERGQAVTVDFGCGGAAASGVLGAKAIGPTRGPIAKKAKKPSKRVACLRKASKLKSKAKRKAAVRRCRARYPANAKKHTAAKSHSVNKRRH
jgi:zinc carboxypeptidase